MDLQDRDVQCQLLDPRQGREFRAAFDAVFTSSGPRIVKTASQAPRANAYAKRFVGTMRRKCLDHLLSVESRHLRGA